MYEKLNLTCEDELSQASGALSDIELLITSCVSSNASEETVELCKSILSRILSSAHKEHKPPSWFCHEWEKELWEKYQRKEIPPCGYKAVNKDGKVDFELV